MRWLKNHWSEILSLIIMAFVFYMLGTVSEISHVKILNIKILNFLCFGASMFFIGILCTWIVMEIVFPPFNRFTDMGHLEEAFEEMRPQEQVFLLTGLFAIFAFLFIYCCSLLC